MAAAPPDGPPPLSLRKKPFYIGGPVWAKLHAGMHRRGKFFSGFSGGQAGGQSGYSPLGLLPAGLPAPPCGLAGARSPPLKGIGDAPPACPGPSPQAGVPPPCPEPGGLAAPPCGLAGVRSPPPGGIGYAPSACPALLRRPGSRRRVRQPPAGRIV